MKSPCEETSFIIHRALRAERLNCFDIRTAPVPGLKQLLPPPRQVQPKTPDLSWSPFRRRPGIALLRFERNHSFPLKHQTKNAPFRGLP